MPGAGRHVPAGLPHIIAASQEKKLFVLAIYKVNLGPEMEWGNLACRENYVSTFDP